MENSDLCLQPVPPKRLRVKLQVSVKETVTRGAVGSAWRCQHGSQIAITSARVESSREEKGPPGSEGMHGFQSGFLVDCTVQ